MLSLNVILSNENKTKIKVFINSNELISKLKSEIYCLNDCLDQITMSLKYGGCCLSNTKTVKFYNLKNDDTLVQSKSDLNDIPNLIISYEPDCISFDQSNEARAQMPCGHVISRESMTEYLQNLILQRKYEILCPGIDRNNKPCKQKWSYSLCKKIAVLTKEEKNKFENGFATIFLSESLETKNCPTCNSIIVKPKDLLGNQVQCSICIKKKQGYDFCWICLKKWTNANEHGQMICGYDFEKVENILSKCKIKKIGNVEGVPEFRVCPKCITIINHSEKCKHIECSKCKTNFCFICLKLKINNVWQCGSYSDPCLIAPRQNIDDLKSIRNNKK